MRWSVAAPHRTALLMIAIGLISLMDAKHTSTTPKDAITRSYYERLRTLQTKAPSRLRQRSPTGYGEDSAVVSNGMKTVAGQTFSEADLKREKTTTAMKAPGYTPVPKAPPARTTQYKKKPDAGVIRAPPSTAPSAFTAPTPTRGPTTLPPSTEPSPPATKLPPLRLTKQHNGSYTLEQMGKKKTSHKALDYFGRPIPEGKMLPTLSKKKGSVKMTPPPSAKSVEGTLPNAIVGFPKQQKSVTHGYDAAVDGSLPATQPSGYDMGVDGAEITSQGPAMTTTPETVTVTKTVFSADVDLYGGASADVQASEPKEAGYGGSEDAAIHSSQSKQSAYGEGDAAVQAEKPKEKNAGGYDGSEDAAVHAEKPKQSQNGGYGDSEDADIHAEKPKEKSTGSYDGSEDAAIHAAAPKQKNGGGYDGSEDAAVHTDKPKSQASYDGSEDAAVMSNKPKQASYDASEDAAVHAEPTQSSNAYGESEDAAILNSISEEDEVVSTTEQPEEPTTEGEPEEVDTPASMDVRDSIDVPDEDAAETEATASSTPATTLAAARSGYEDAGVETATSSSARGYDEAVEGASNETEVESTTASVETTTTIFAARNPYGGGEEEQDREVEVTIETTTPSSEASTSGYEGVEEGVQREGEEDALLSSSTPSSSNSTDVTVDSTTSHPSESTTDMLMNFEPKSEDAVAGEIQGEEEEEMTTPADGVEAASDLDDNAVEEVTLSPENATSAESGVDDAEVERAVERILGDELAEQSTTVKGPTVTSAPMKVFDKAPTLVHNRLAIKPQEAQRGSNATAPLRGFKETCPPPRRCPRNCFVYVNDNGCQDCQCLWQSLPCETSEDCPEGAQYCDEGKCQCRPGYKQNMRKSGSCEIDESFQGVRSIAAHVKSDAAIMKNKEMHQVKEEAHPGYRRKRATVVKTFRDERLQWPGPCDNDDQCPPNLWCLQGDCWALPDKPIKMDQLIKKDTSTIPSSFPIESTDRKKLEDDLWRELQEEEEREKGSVTINRDSEDGHFDAGQLVVPLSELTTPSAKARSRFFHGDNRSDGFIISRTSTTTAAPAAVRERQQQLLQPTMQPPTQLQQLQQRVAPAAPPGFEPSIGEMIEMEKTRVRGRGAPDFDSFPIRASGVKLSHPDLLASREISPLHSALFLPPPSLNEGTTTTTPEPNQRGVKQIELPQEKSVHFDAREIARRRKELKKRLEKTKRKQRRARVESEPLNPIEFPLSSKQRKVIDNEAREGEEEDVDRPVSTQPTASPHLPVAPRLPSILGDDYTDESFQAQFAEQKKRLESSTLRPLKRRTTPVSNSVERSSERDEPSGESNRVEGSRIKESGGGGSREFRGDSRRIDDEETVREEEHQKKEFHPRKASVPPLSTFPAVETELPITSSPIGRILSLEERRIARAQADLDREISEALKTKSVDDLLREQIRRINGDSEGLRSATLTFSTTPPPRFSSFQTSPQFERTTLPSTDTTFDEPAITPGKPFEDTETVWLPMEERTTVKTLRDFRRSPSSRLIYEYTSENIKHKPVRVEMDRAVDSMRDECSEDSQCGSRLRCCRKRWCDRSRNCGTGNFCLPSCEMTKMTHLGRGEGRESLIDIIYD